MLIIYEPDKKDKNTLDFLKVDMITIKMILHLVSLAKKSKFYKTCSKCAPRRWWHTWGRRAKLSITLTHSSLIMPWICWVIATLSTAIVFGLFWYTWFFKKPQRWKSSGFKSSECGDHSGKRRLLISRPAKRRSSHSIMMLAVWELHHLVWTIALLDARHNRQRVSSRNCWESRCKALYWPSLSLQHHSQTKTVRLSHVSIWQPTQCTLQSAVVSEGLHLVLEIPRTQNSCCWHGLIERSGLHYWTTHSEKNLDFLQSCFWTTDTSQHVLPCYFAWEFVWSVVCVGTIEGHSSRFCERINEKDPTF